MATQTTNISPRQLVRQRLHLVADLLQTVVAGPGSGNKPTTANEPSTTKLLHDLRVGCRRAETALKACHQLFTHKQSTWFRDQLRSIRKSCNVLRDDEVLRKWLREQPQTEVQQELLKSISHRIKAGHSESAQQARAALQRHHFRRHVHDLWSTEDDPRTTETIGTPLWRGQLGRWLFQILDRLIQTIPDDQDDYVALHQLRIAVKRLRYGTELAIELAPELRLRELTGRLEKMQDKLGALHDAVVRLERLETEFASHAKANDLIEAARKELQQSAADWTDWWQPNVLPQIIRPTGNAVSTLLAPAKKR